MLLDQIVVPLYNAGHEAGIDLEHARAIIWLACAWCDVFRVCEVSVAMWGACVSKRVYVVLLCVRLYCTVWREYTEWEIEGVGGAVACIEYEKAGCVCQESRILQWAVVHVRAEILAIIYNKHFAIEIYFWASKRLKSKFFTGTRIAHLICQCYLYWTYLIFHSYVIL